MLVCLAASMLLSTLFCPLIIALCKKFNWYDEVDPRKIHTGLIPRLGGVALFAAFIISFGIYCAFFHPYDISESWPLFAGGMLILLFGVIDDFINMRAKIKFLVQIIAALLVVTSPCYFTHMFFIEIPPLIGRVFTFFWIIGIVNAFNLIDGMDWLCGGLSFFAVLTLGFIFMLDGNDIFAMHFILCGAIFGFLVWNKPNAKIFLGDGGSQSLGYIIAASPLFYPDRGHFNFNLILVMILLCSIPITDVIAAILRRKREGRSFFSPDRGHIHHKLLNIGFTKSTAIFFLLMLQFLLCVIVLTTYFMDPFAGGILLIVAIAFVFIIFIVFHYLNRSVNMRHAGHLSEAPQKEH